MQSESFDEQIARIRGMAAGDPTWDLSDNDCAALKALLEAYDRMHILRPVSEYHEDHGSVIFWHVPICEPPYVGTGCGSWKADGEPTYVMKSLESGWLNYWSPLPDCRKLMASIKAVGE